MRWRALPWPWLCAALSGLLLALSYPGWDQGWLIWLALTPLIAAVVLGPRQRRQWRRDALLGWVTGVVFFSTTFYWLGAPLADLFRTRLLIGIPPLLSMYLGLFLGFWSWFLGILIRPSRLPSPVSICPDNTLPSPGAPSPSPSPRSAHNRVPPGTLSAADASAPGFLDSWRNIRIAFFAAAAWVAQEWIRGWLLGGFGWNGLGIALHGNLAIIQIADIVGVFGLSFLVAFTNVIAFITVRRFAAEIGRLRARPHWDFSVMMACVVGAFSYGVHALQHPVDMPQAAAGSATAIPLHFAAVQPYIPESFKSDPAQTQGIYDRYDYLTHTALAGVPKPQLLLWPEASTLTDLLDSETYAWVKEIDASTDAGFILGSFLSTPGVGDFNIAACITQRGARTQIYRKMHLVPFGEYVPLRHTFPLFAKIAGELVPGDLQAGREYSLFQLDHPSIRVAPLICFEDTDGDLTRRMAGLGGVLLVNITNDSWFGRSPGSTQHLCNALFRAIETRRPLLRDANTGITCVVDCEGRVLQSLRDADGSPFLEGVLFGTMNIPSHPPTTFYMLHGDWVAHLSVAIAGLFIAYYFFRR